MANFGKRSTAEQVTAGIDLTGKTALITGVNSGIGEETARVLSMRGAKVIGAARTLEKAETVCKNLAGETIPLACELSDPSSIATAINAIKSQNISIDMLIANAGIMALPKLEKANGIELQFMTNHLGHFQLVTGLLDCLSANARITIVSSSAHNFAPKEGIDFDNLDGSRSYSAMAAYGRSKLANVLFANELARRLSSKGVTANSLHPGVINTNLGRHMNKVLASVFAVTIFWMMKSVGQGAATTCYVAAHPDVESLSGKYFDNCQEGKMNPLGRSEDLAKRLWEYSEQKVAELTAS
ncbi:MAG: SDR family oxidoreductase [Pseudomonadota bacterium]